MNEITKSGGLEMVAIASSFNKWNKQKKMLHFSEKSPLFSENEVWWCGVGENVGVEINGKNQRFSRPVYVYKKLSRHSFLGIPMTSKYKSGSWYVTVPFKGKNSTAVLSQIRIISARRLYERMGELDEVDSEKIDAGFRELYIKQK